ncbi:MAG: hypothetical protein AB1668_02475 [Nanoarchaeota archaeon]
MGAIDDLLQDGEEIDNRRRDALEVITEGDLKAYFRCPYSYYLRKHVGLSKIPLHGFALQALLFEQARRMLFNLRDPNIGRIVPFQIWAGPETKPAQEMNTEELEQYLAVDKLGGFLTGKFQAITANGSFGERPLVWSFGMQIPANWEDIRLQRSVKTNPLYVGGNRYRKFVLNQGAPILGCINLEKGFTFEGNTFSVKFPELRKGMYIDDPALWSFNTDFPDEENRSDINRSVLVTLRILGYCTLAHQHLFHRLKWGVDENLAETWGGGEKYLDKKVTYRHFNATQDQTTATSRSDADLDGLRRAVERFKEGIAREQFLPDFRRCSSCSYNTLGLNEKLVCDELARCGKKIKPAAPAYYFNPQAFSIEVKKEQDKITLTGVLNRDSKSRNSKLLSRSIANYELHFLEGVCTSRYWNEYARGFGFEEKMLAEADRQLQEQADSLGRTVVHEINFKRDFAFAGQKKIEATLRQLGYQQNKKEYYPHVDRPHVEH